jgi:hypothetical protein
MSFVKSLMFGSEGSYNVLDTPVTFDSNKSGESSQDSSARAVKLDCDPITGEVIKIESEAETVEPVKEQRNLPKRIMNTVANNRAFQVMSQGYTHVLVHEMGHALAYKLFTGDNASIIIHSDCTGETHMPKKPDLPAWQQSIIASAGSLSNLAFSGGKLAAAAALRSVSKPVAIILGSGAALWMVGELMYSASSALSRNEGDFGIISSKTHLLAAGTAVTSTCALGVLGATALL